MHRASVDIVLELDAVSFMFEVQSIFKSKIALHILLKAIHSDPKHGAIVINNRHLKHAIREAASIQIRSLMIQLHPTLILIATDRNAKIPKRPTPIRSLLRNSRTQIRSCRSLFGSLPH